MRHLVGKHAFLAVMFGLLFLAPFVGNEYHAFIANLILLYIILALGLNLLIGFAGQLALVGVTNGLDRRHCLRQLGVEL